LAATFSCRVGSLPFTYLELPLSINKPTVQDCLPLVVKVEKRLCSRTLVLTQGGKLKMVNSVLSYMATFYMCSVKVLIEILNQIDKYRRHYLWRCGDINAKKPPLAAWKMVTKPKLKGGLGVINLTRRNEALLLKNCTSSLTKRTCHGLSYYGLNIMPMVRYEDKLREGHSGGEVT
jgi:hypothetical protein